MKPRVCCELCSAEASLYCASDSAFLCSDCDASVHRSNFLFARHVRRTLCLACQSFDGNLLSGVGSPLLPSLCPDCESNAESASSTSSATRPEKCGGGRRQNRRMGRQRTAPEISAKGILVIWARKLGLRRGSSSRCVALALHAFRACSREFTVLPSRVSLASSLWLAANICVPRRTSACRLMRLQQLSRAPAKLILLLEAKLTRMLIRPDEPTEEEGWGECPDCRMLIRST